MFTFRYKNRHFLRYYFESQNPTFRRTGRILSGKAAGMIPTATGRIGKPLVAEIGPIEFGNLNSMDFYIFSFIIYKGITIGNQSKS